MLFKLDKYILIEFWLPFVSGAGIITGIWLGIDKFKEVFKLLAQSGASLETGFVILGLETPQILAITMPVSILLASFLTFQKLSFLSEVIAMRAAGTSFARLMRPALILGILALLISFFLNEFIVPVTNPIAKKLYTFALYKDPIVNNAAQGFSFFEKDSNFATKRIFYVRKVKDNILEDIVILDFSREDIVMIHTASKGTWEAQKGGWALYDGSSSYIKDSDGPQDIEEPETMHLVTNFRQILIPSSLNPKEILENKLDVGDMSFLALRQFVREQERVKTTHKKLSDYQTKYFNKYAYPFSCMFLAIIGACLGLTGRRKVINWGYIAIGLIVFVFYLSESVFFSLGRTGKMEPLLAVWVTNLILAVIACGIYVYKSRR